MYLYCLTQENYPGIIFLCFSSFRLDFFSFPRASFETTKLPSRDPAYRSHVGRPADRRWCGRDRFGSIRHSAFCWTRTTRSGHKSGCSLLLRSLLFLLRLCCSKIPLGKMSGSESPPAQKDGFSLSLRWTFKLLSRRLFHQRPRKQPTFGYASSRASARRATKTLT